MHFPCSSTLARPALRLVVPAAWLVQSVLWALPAAAQTPPAPPRDGEPKVERRVAEDELNRIEELRVRGETQRVVVKPKTAGAREYEIEPRRQGADPSQKGARAGGDRVWRLLSF